METEIKVQDVADLNAAPVEAKVARVVDESVDIDVEKEQALEDFKANAIKSIDITFEQVAKWKEEFGDIIMLMIAGKVYIHRVITHGEYQEMQKLDPEKDDAQSWILKKCILAPSSFKDGDISKKPAGVITSLEKSIEANSGFQPDTQPILL